MAKKSVIERQKKKEILYLKYLQRRENIISLLKKEKDIYKKLAISFILQKLNRNSSKTRLVNRCWLSGRGRGVYNFFGLEKSSLRKMAFNTFLPGLIKSSW